MPAEVTEDAVLGGKLRLKQPSAGHRVGHDAILLAAACPARAGECVVDLGAGVGAAGLALARRVDGVKVVLVEVDAALAALAAENAQRNGLSARVSAVALDVAASARAFAVAGLAPESVTRILTTMVGLYRSERPLAFFSGLGVLLAIVSVGLAIPIFVTYFEQGIVPRIPTAILSTGLMLLASLSIVAGLVLDTVTRGRRETKLIAYLEQAPPGEDWRRQG